MSDKLLTRLLRRIGSAAEPLLNPDAPARRSREAATKRSLDRLEAAVSRLDTQVERVTDRLERLDRRQIEHLEAAVATLRWSTRRQVAFSDRLLRASNQHSEHEFVRERVLRRLRRLDRAEGTILVGPWTGEVGFELLYWVPFVRWAVEQLGIDHSQLIIVSRGDTASWYGLPGARYVDVLERRSASELRAHMAEAKKQRTLRVFDRRLIRELAAESGGRVGVLHPALMYALYMPYWKQVTSRRWVEQFANFARISAPTASGLTLPDDYVAVRFYFSDCFPETPSNKALVEEVVKAVSRERNVVVLSSGARVDDHRDAAVLTGSGRVYRLDHLMRPETNLAVQTAVIAGASAFIGTYGGFSYLAPLCGVNTVALYSIENYYSYHLDFARYVFEQVQGGSLTVIDAAMRELVGEITRSDAFQ